MAFMYLRFFELNHHPFTSSAGGEALFIGRPQQEALAHLRYALEEGDGFMVVTGDRGVGKTTICRAFMERLEPSTAAAFLSAPVRSPAELLRRVNAAFGISARDATLKGLIDRLNDFLMRRKMAGGKAVVVIDDAQTLSATVLEQIRLISNLETTREKLIHLVLIGEPGLLDTLDSHALRQMGQRVSVRYELGPLSEEESSAYIRHRLSKASAGPPVLFDPEALRIVYRFARGNPRRIDTACEAALAAAFSAGEKAVGEGAARAAVSEMERPQAGGATRTRRRMLFAAGAGCLLAVVLGLLSFNSWRPGAVALPPERSPSAPEAAAVRVVKKPLPAAPPAAEVLPPPAAPPEPEAFAAPPAVPAAAAPPLPAGSVPMADGTFTHSVQVGAFLLPDNAARLAERLAAKGHEARVFEAVDSGGRRWHTVRVGDHLSYAAARAQSEAFTHAEGIQSIVRPYGRF
jgi:general secretion pathway protein A